MDPVLNDKAAYKRARPGQKHGDRKLKMVAFSAMLSFKFARYPSNNIPGN